ncbi:MAG: TlpA family protein disulfide reductase [Pseudomonadota bacterium]|uniref:TlpA family protein disulfide reductase n=1 Tax=Thermithiobacillus tepidarius TaxID=929 RepID=UPI00041E5C6A|nr:TlpA disulfide reductase family protein [Thermithiobacillus tepidarius]
MMRILLLIGALLLTQAAAAAAPAPPRGLMPLDGRPAPALRLADMNGQVTDLQQLRGRWVLVHFWASWCGPCRREMPTLQRLSARIPPTRLQLVLVNTAESEDEVFSFLAGVTPELNTLMDRDGRVTERWQPRGLPSSFLVDPQGRLRYLALGGRDWTTPAYLNFLQALTAP